MLYLNDKIIAPTIFPDKTSQVWKLDKTTLNGIVNVIKWDFESESEFMQLAQLVSLIKTLDEKSKLIVDIPYFPYARQDKEISNESTFALRTFSKLLASLEIDHILTYDIHSDIAKEYLPNLVSKFPQEVLNIALTEIDPRLIIFPDKGARSRYDLNFMGNSVTIIKERDQLTGELKIIDIEGDTDLLNGAKCLMVDDLCDGGGTFIMGAKFLKAYGIKEVSLYTTHGIYSKGINVLKQNGIKRIFNHKGEV